MSKLRLNFRRRRWSLVLAILIIAMTAGVVFAIWVGGPVSRFSNAVGGSCVAYDSATLFQDVSRVKWGRPEGAFTCPADGMATNKSGYTFDGATAPGEVLADANFLIGKFTHHNNPIVGGTSITAVDMALRLDVCAVGNQLTFSGYTFYHDETNNSPTGTTCSTTQGQLGYCTYGPGDVGWPTGTGFRTADKCPFMAGDLGPNGNGCADRVILPYETSQTFQCGGYTLTLYLAGFVPTTATAVCPATPAGPFARYFYTREGVDNYACVYGRVTAPSAVTLAAFTAAEQSGAIVINWDTYSEIGNAGFNLYRDTAPDGLGVRLNDVLIPSKGPNSPEGFSYSFTDSANLVPGTTYYYRLEDVSTSGTGTVHDPVSVTFVGSPNAVGLASFGAASAPAVLSLAGLALAALGAAAVARRRKA